MSWWNWLLILSGVGLAALRYMVLPSVVRYWRIERM